MSPHKFASMEVSNHRQLQFSDEPTRLVRHDMAIETKEKIPIMISSELFVGCDSERHWVCLKDLTSAYSIVG